MTDLLTAINTLGTNLGNQITDLTNAIKNAGTPPPATVDLTEVNGKLDDLARAVAEIRSLEAPAGGAAAGTQVPGADTTGSADTAAAGTQSGS